MPRNRRNGSTAAMDPLFISVPQKLGRATKASRHHHHQHHLPPKGLREKHAARRCAISGRNGTGSAWRQLHGNYSPMQLIARLRFSATTSRTGNLTECRTISKPVEHGRAEGRHDSVTMKEDCRNASRWLRTPHDVDVPLAAERQCSQHLLSLPCRPRSIRHSEAEVLGVFLLATRSHFLGPLLPWNQVDAWLAGTRRVSV